MRRFVSGISMVLFLGIAALGASGCGKNACEQADEDIAEKYVTCEVDESAASAPVECTEALADERACRADCYLDASCDTLKGNDAAGSSALQTCLSQC